jgi:uncharacterized protein (DUF2126 family)
MELEIRMGIEPWHVLGEEISRFGTARYVDSSLEQVQVKLKGLNGTRYVLLCNGVRVPLRETAVKGEWVCGVRFRAWQPPSALHPTIGVDTPLVFDLVDTWNNRSIGGCRYHVGHPGGRGYDRFPVNSFEAESRRISRFWDHGHTQGKVEPKETAAQAAPGRSTHFVEKSHQSPDTAVPDTTTIPDIVINKEYPNTLDLRQYWTAKKT